MRSVSSPIAQALAQLQLERDHLAARLEKVEALIASMRDVFHLPKVPAHVKAFPRAASANTNGHSTVSADAIRAALRAGPVSPGELATRLHVDRRKLSSALKGMEDEGVVVMSGTTRSRLIALPGQRAKEVP